MGGGSLNLVASIVADPSGVGPGVAEAEARIKAFAANSAAAVEGVNRAATTLAQTLKAQGATAEQAGQIYKQMGMTGAEAADQIAAAFNRAGEAAKGAGAATKSSFDAGDEAVRILR